MSDVPQGPGWWQASDGKYYPPEQFQGGAQQGPPMAQPQGYGMAAVGPQNEQLAIWSLVSSIAGLVIGFCCGIGLIGSIAGIVMGVIARSRIRDSNGQLQGDGMALGGIIVGAVGVVWFVAWIILFFAVGTFDFYTSS